MRVIASLLSRRWILNRMSLARGRWPHRRRCQLSGLSMEYREFDRFFRLPFPRWRSHWNAEDESNGAQVLLISSDGKKLGEMTEGEAQRRAEEVGLSLKKVGQVKGGILVMKMVDMAAEERAKRVRKRTERKKRLENRRLSTVKSIRVSPTTGEHDFGIKMARAREFLESGRSVKVFVMFKKGQGKLQLEAEHSLKKAENELKDWGNIEENEEEEPASDEERKKPLEVMIRPLKKWRKASARAANQSNGPETLIKQQVQ